MSRPRVAKVPGHVSAETVAGMGWDELVEVQIGIGGDRRALHSRGVDFTAWWSSPRQRGLREAVTERMRSLNDDLAASRWFSRRERELQADGRRFYSLSEREQAELLLLRARRPPIIVIDPDGV